MNVQLINDWYMTTDSGGQMGTTDTSGVTDRQKHNATKVYQYFKNLGWSLSAIAGMLGNFHLESWMSPAYIQDTNRWRLPNRAASLSDVPNSVMINFYKEYYNVSERAFAIGLAQWDGRTPNNPPGQKLVSFAIRYDLNWYDGDTQLFRIKREQETNIQWESYRINGIQWTWGNFPTNDQTPEVSARIWQACYEGSSLKRLEIRKQNARYWYNYFYEEEPGPGPDPGPDPGPGPDPEPEPPTGWVSGEQFSEYALAYNGQYIPYDQCDCIAFVNKVWQDIPATSGSITNGTNSIWRSTRTFDTTAPDGQEPCPELWFKAPIGQLITEFGSIPPGTLLFHQISEEGPPAIPPQYAGDGIGNFVHVGIYCGENRVMQSGGRDSASVPGGGVHLSTYDSSAWNYAAFLVYVDCTAGEDPEPGDTIPAWLYMIYGKRKKVLKHGRYDYSRRL